MVNCTSLKTHSHDPLDARVRLGQLREQRVVEELLHAHVLAHTLSSPRLHHELPRQRLHRARLQRPQHDAPVKRIPGDDGPVIKVALPERLALRVVPQVSLETERFDRGDQGLDRVHRRAGLGVIGDDVPSALGQHRVDGAHAIGGGLNFARKHGLHQPRRRHQERRVRHPARGGDHLPTAPVQGLIRDDGVEDLKLDVADGLVAERALPGAPLETLHDGLLDRVEQGFVNLAR